MENIMFVIVWQFKVPPENAAEFERQYGPAGVWAKFFSRSQEYLGTRLLRDTEQRRQYVTFDFWKSEAAFREFEEKFRDEYKAIDTTLERLTATERRLGVFDSDHRNQSDE